MWITLDSPATFQAGQYINLRIPGESAPRAFSIASAPQADGAIELNVRQVPGVKTTTWIHQGLRAGDKVSLSGLYGRFMDHLGKREMNVNMVTCGGQVTIPMVYAVSRVQPVSYGEIVATVSSRSVGPGTRKNIDEFTRTTTSAVENVGGAKRGKAIIVVNPAEPPLMMRDTIHCLALDTPKAAEIEESVDAMSRRCRSTCRATDW